MKVPATCATCRWWTKIDADEDYPLATMARNTGEEAAYWAETPEEMTQRDALRDRVRECKSPKLHFYVLPQAGEAAIIDGSEYKGSLCTDGQFGCVNHETKGATDE